MKLKNNLKYIATPAKIFMTVLIVLIAVSILQGIILEIERTFAHAKQRPATTKPEAELTQEEKRIDRIRKSAKEFLPDGTIHLIHKPRRTPGRMDEPEIEQIYDVNDNLLWEGTSNERPYRYLSWATKQSSRYVFTRERMKQMQMITPGFSRNIEISVGSYNKTEQIWRYHPGAEYFKGYNTNGEKIGYVGSTGFTDSKSKAKPFGKFRLFTAWCPQDSSSPTLLWQTQRRIYQIDFEKQHVELIFESTEADIEIERTSLHAWRDLKPGAVGSSDPKKYRPLLLCVTEDGKHHLILREPKQQLSLAVPRSSVTATKQDIFVHRFGSDAFPPADIVRSRELYDKWLRERRGKPRNLWTELYKVDNQGGLELLNRYDWTIPPRPVPVVRARDPRPAVQRGVSQFSPPLYDLVVRLLGRKFWLSAYQYQNRSDFFYSLVRMIMDIRPHGGVISRVLSALMMGFVLWHGWPRRTSWAKFAFWLIFVGAFNLAGLLTYLALNHTTVIKCPVCGKRRGLDRVDCVRCQAELPAPERGKLDLIFST
ncbi:MAG: hypothetical protein IIC00_17315 [Planctomycetes bacterium]|nr:hypothetical protein [Planctomycetota bacterium]